MKGKENESYSKQITEMQKPCKGCIHHSCNMCNYLFNVGRRRPCPPGRGCTVKTTKKRRRPKRGITINNGTVGDAK